MKGFSRFLRLGFWVLVYVILTTSVFAGAATDGSQKSVITLDEVVVSATKTPEKRKDISNAVIIMDNKDIQASGAKSIGELLANEPGIDWQTYGNYGGAPSRSTFAECGGMPRRYWSMASPSIHLPWELPMWAKSRSTTSSASK